MLPKLVVNRQFMYNFMKADKPCCAMGIIEMDNTKKSLLALRLNDLIPNEVLNKGFCFGNSLYGTSEYEVIQFVFGFYGFKNYNVLINPNNYIVQEVLSMMIESRDYFFLLIQSSNNVTAFRSEIEDDTLIGLKDNLLRIENSQTTNEEYLKSVYDFEENPYPNGEMLNWVCNDDVEYLKLDDENRLYLNPQ